MSLKFPEWTVSLSALQPLTQDQAVAHLVTKHVDVPYGSYGGPRREPGREPAGPVHLATGHLAGMPPHRTAPPLRQGVPSSESSPQHRFSPGTGLLHPGAAAGVPAPRIRVLTPLEVLCSPSSWVPATGSLG